MAEYDKKYTVDRKPVKIPSGCVAAWDTSTAQPTIWYDKNGVITEWTGGSVANPMAAALNAGSYKITALATGTNANDAVNKAQMDAAIATGNEVSFTTGTINSSVNWSTQVIAYKYSGDLGMIEQAVTNISGYTGNTLVDIDPLLAAARPHGTTYKPFTYYDDSASAWLQATLKINTDGTVDYYPPNGVTPATNDILYINVFYRT